MKYGMLICVSGVWLWILLVIFLVIMIVGVFRLLVVMIGMIDVLMMCSFLSLCMWFFLLIIVMLL